MQQPQIQDFYNYAQEELSSRLAKRDSLDKQLALLQSEIHHLSSERDNVDYACRNWRKAVTALESLIPPRVQMIPEVEHKAEATSPS